MKDKLFDIFNFCSKNNIEFDLENNKEKQNSVGYNSIERKSTIIIADFEDKELDKLLEKFLTELKDTIK